MIADERDRRAERALDEVREGSAIAPSLWLYEITNALLVAGRRGRLDRPASDMLADLAALEIGIAEPRGFPVTECELAVEHGLTVYDTAYLHVAIERQIPIATLDAKLARAAKKHKLLFA